MSDNCPTCGQVLPWKRPNVQEIELEPFPAPSRIVAIASPPPKKTKEEMAAEAEKKRLEAVKYMQDNAKSCVCWLCNAHISIRKYADHVQRHREENWIPRNSKSSKSRAEVFAEWQQQDAVD